MIDLHTHILPGVDDGAKNIEESMEIAKWAYENGINKIFATPHYIEGEGYNNLKQNKDILNELNNKLKELDIDVEVLLGNEVFITPEIISLIDNEEISTLNNSRYILIEFPRLQMPLYIEDIIYELRLRGYVPIIAHPERYVKVIEDPNFIHNLITKGALCQLNLPSLLKMYGEKVKETAEILLKHKMIHFIGTDTHSSKGITKSNYAINKLKEIISEDEFNKLLFINGEAILKNEDLNIEEPILYKPKGKFSKIIDNFFKKAN